MAKSSAPSKSSSNTKSSSSLTSAASLASQYSQYRPSSGTNSNSGNGASFSKSVTAKLSSPSTSVGSMFRQASSTSYGGSTRPAQQQSPSRPPQLSRPSPSQQTYAANHAVPVSVTNQIAKSISPQASMFRQASSYTPAIRPPAAFESKKIGSGPASANDSMFDMPGGGNAPLAGPQHNLFRHASSMGPEGYVPPLVKAGKTVANVTGWARDVATNPRNDALPEGRPNYFSPARGPYARYSGQPPSTTGSIPPWVAKSQARPTDPQPEQAEPSLLTKMWSTIVGPSEFTGPRKINPSAIPGISFDTAPAGLNTMTLPRPSVRPPGLSTGIPAGAGAASVRVGGVPNLNASDVGGMGLDTAPADYGFGRPLQYTVTDPKVGFQQVTQTGAFAPSTYKSTATPSMTAFSFLDRLASDVRQTQMQPAHPTYRVSPGPGLRTDVEMARLGIPAVDIPNPALDSGNHGWRPKLVSPPTQQRSATAQIAGQSLPSLPPLSANVGGIPMPLDSPVAQTVRPGTIAPNKFQSPDLQRQMALVDLGIGEQPAFRAPVYGMAATADPGGTQALRPSPGLNAAATPSPQYAAYMRDVDSLMPTAEAAIARNAMLAGQNSVRPEFPGMAPTRPALDAGQMAEVSNMLYPRGVAALTPADPNRSQAFAQLDGLGATVRRDPVLPDVGQVWAQPANGPVMADAGDTLTAADRAAAPKYADNAPIEPTDIYTPPRPARRQVASGGLLGPLPSGSVTDIPDPVAQEILPGPRSNNTLFAGSLIDPFAGSGSHTNSNSSVQTAALDPLKPPVAPGTPALPPLKTRAWGADFGLNPQLDPEWVRRIYQWQLGDMKGAA